MTVHVGNTHAEKFINSGQIVNPVELNERIDTRYIENPPAILMPEHLLPENLDNRYLYELPAYLSETNLDAAYADALTAIYKNEIVVNVADHGVIGNGIADDTNGMLAALALARDTKTPLHIPTGLVIGLSAPITFHAGIVAFTNGSRFTTLAALGRTAIIQIQSNVIIHGGIDLTVTGGDDCGGITVSGASNVRIDVVRAFSAVAGAGKNNTRDNGLKIVDSANISIDSVIIENFDHSFYAERVPDLRLGWVKFLTYKTGLHLDDVPRFRLFKGGEISGASPNTAFIAGHNGLLLGAELAGSENIRIHNLTVKDAGEHGFRVGGPLQQKNLWFTNCSAINVGGTGFKILGSTITDNVFNENIVIDNFLAEDCGSTNENCNGMLIQMVKQCTINNPRVVKRNKTYAAINGIRLGGVHNVSINNPRVRDTSTYGITIDESHGACNDIEINNARVIITVGTGIYLKNPGVDFKDIRINGNVKSTSPSAGSIFYAGKGATAPADDGTWTGLHTLDLTATPDNVVATINNSTSVNYLAACYAFLRGKKNTAVIFRNSSEWINFTDGVKYRAKAGAWVAL